MQNQTKPMVIKFSGNVRSMLFIISQVVSHLIESIVVTAFSIEILNSLNSSIVLILRIIEHFNALGKRPYNIPTQFLDIEQVAGSDVSVIDFIFV